MRRTLLTLVVLAGLLVPAAAYAGFTANYRVTIYSNGAQGTMHGARNASDSKQFIGCGSYDSYASCFARGADGTVRSCYTFDAGKIAAIGTVASNSRIYFTSNSDGTCSYISVNNGSQYLE